MSQSNRANTTQTPRSRGFSIVVDGKQRPTTNSNGQPIATTERGLVNFWRWFGGKPDNDFTELQNDLLTTSFFKSEIELSDSIIRSLKSHSGNMSYFRQSRAVVDHILDNIRIGEKNMIFRKVLSIIREQPEIINTIIELIPVDVMDNLKRQQLSAYMILHDESMLQDLFSVNGNSTIPFVRDITNSIIRGVAFSTTEASSQLGFWFGDINSAEFTGKSNLISPTIFTTKELFILSYPIVMDLKLDSTPRTPNANHKNKFNFITKVSVLGIESKLTKDEVIKNIESGTSKVVDELGRPLVVYHGTPNEFNEFETPSWFTENKDEGKEWGKNGVKQVYLKVNNPYNMDESNDDGESIETTPYDEDWIDEKIEEGYDGVSGSQIIGTDKSTIYRNWVSFSPAQIKSATGNDGSFDSDDGSILSGYESYGSANVVAVMEQFAAQTPGGLFFTGETRIDADYDPSDAEYSQRRAYQVLWKTSYWYSERSNPETYTFADLADALTDVDTPGSEEPANEWFEPYKILEIVFRGLWLDANGDVVEADPSDLSWNDAWDEDHPLLKQALKPVAEQLPHHFEGDLLRTDFPASEADARELLSEVERRIHEPFPMVVGDYTAQVPATGSKYRTVVLTHNRDEDKEYYVKLRIANHTYNPANNKADERSGLFVSIEIANNNPTASRFPTLYSLRFTGSNTFNDVVDAFVDRLDEIVEQIDAGRFEGLGMVVSPVGFYSTVEKALDLIGQARGTTSQMKAMLLKNGAKQAEMDWMGWDNHFPDAGKTITKADVQQWIDENRIEVVEVVKKKATSDDTEMTDLTEEAAEKYQQLEEIARKWETREYDERHGYEMSEDEREEVEKWYDKYGSYYIITDHLLPEILQNPDNYIQENVVSDDTKFSQYQEPGGENYNEVLLTMPRVEKPFNKKVIYENGKYYVEGLIIPFETKQDAENYIKRTYSGKIDKNSGNFHSSHFSEPNILAHVRFNERTDANGDRVLFVEEFQSDWAQKGKKEGFDNPKDRKRINELADLFLSDRSKNQEGTPERIEYEALTAKNTPGGVPDMPFRKTDQWLNLAMRRMIRYAAENGFDRIAWTDGVQQVKRYEDDLRKQVDQIDTTKEGDSVEVYAIKDGDAVFEHTIPLTGTTSIGGKDVSLEDVIGKDLAQKVREGGAIQSFKGDKLTIGGEGMKAFYDGIVPAAASKLGKPFGAKVETVAISNVGQVQSLPITQRMRVAAGEGVPLFGLGMAMTGRKGAMKLKGEMRREVVLNLYKAEKMETRKADPLAIRLATGWERGADGMWRYEVPDAKFASSFVDELTKSVENFKDGVTQERYTHLEAVYGTDAPVFLYYPALRYRVGVRINIHPNNRNTGYYKHGLEGDKFTLPDDPEIEVMGNSIEGAESVLVHEIQHAIQDIEGFAQGGNTANKRTRQNYLDEYFALVKGQNYNELSERYDKGELTGKEKTDYERLDKYLKELLEKSYTAEEDAYNEYRRMAGEVEARNAQARMNYTPEQRRQTLISSTEDVNRSEQINLKGVGADAVGDDAMLQFAIRKGYGKTKSDLRKLKNDIRFQREYMAETQADFNKRAKAESEKSRIETAENEKRFSEGESYTSGDDYARSIQAKIDTGVELTPDEMDYMNANGFAPAGYVVDDNENFVPSNSSGKPTTNESKQPWQMTFDEYLQSERDAIEKEYGALTDEKFEEYFGKEEFMQKWQQALIKSAEAKNTLSTEVLDSYVEVFGKGMYMYQFRGRSEQPQYLFKDRREPQSSGIEHNNKPIGEESRMGEGWRNEFERAKADGDLKALDVLYNKVKVALNGTAQRGGDSTVRDFEALKADIEAYAMELKSAAKANINQLSSDEMSFAEYVKDLIRTNRKADLRKDKLENKAASDFLITDPMVVKELAEYAVVMAARIIANDRHLTLIERYRQMVELYNNQPVLLVRSSNSTILQQYSTPAPISFLAGYYVAHHTKHIADAYYFEPSAGTGLLTIALDPSKTYVNEIDPVRLRILRQQSFAGVSNFDASDHRNIPYESVMAGVVTNPPFGNIENGVFKSLEHQMAYLALGSMKANGAAAIIIGGHTEYDDKGRIKGRDRDFFLWLYKSYHVDDVINIDGKKLYVKQGTGYNVRLILLRGKDKPGGLPPLLKNGSKTVSTFGELFDRVSRHVVPAGLLPDGITIKISVAGITGVLDGIDDVKIVSSEDDPRLKVITPYNSDFVAFCHKMNARWNNYEKAWMFDKRDEADVRKMLIKLYGTDGTMQPETVDVLLRLDPWMKNCGRSIDLFGRSLLFTYSKNERVRVAPNAIIKSGGVRSSGSAKYPCIVVTPGTVLLVRDVPVTLFDEAVAKYGNEVVSRYAVSDAQPVAQEQKQPEVTTTPTRNASSIFDLGFDEVPKPTGLSEIVKNGVAIRININS